MGRWGRAGTGSPGPPPEPGSGPVRSGRRGAALPGLHSRACAIRDGDGNDLPGPRGGRSLLKRRAGFSLTSPVFYYRALAFKQLWVWEWRVGGVCAIHSFPLASQIIN